MGASGADLPGVASSLAWSFLSLVFVCLVAVLALRWLAGRTAGRSTGAIRVLARCHLEQRRSVYLLGVGGRCFLVGVSEGPMSLLAEVDPINLPEEPPRRSGGGAGVGELLGRLLRKGGP